MGILQLGEEKRYGTKSKNDAGVDSCHPDSDIYYDVSSVFVDDVDSLQDIVRVNVGKPVCYLPV